MPWLAAMFGSGAGAAGTAAAAGTGATAGAGLGAAGATGAGLGAAGATGAGLGATGTGIAATAAPLLLGGGAKGGISGGGPKGSEGMGMLKGIMEKYGDSEKMMFPGGPPLPDAPSMPGAVAPINFGSWSTNRRVDPDTYEMFRKLYL